MIQLIEPNLSVVGLPNFCEAYVQAVFGATRNEATAHQAYLDSQVKHTGNPPSDLSVPIFYDWVGKLPGDTTPQDYGHVAVWVKGQIYTSPLSGAGHKVYNSIQELQSAYALGNYLGWTEDISNVTVVGEDMDKVDLDHLKKMIYDATGLQAETNQNFMNNLNLSYPDAIDQIHGYKDTRDKQLRADAYDGLQAQIKDLQAQVDAGGGEYEPVDGQVYKKKGTDL